MAALKRISDLESSVLYLESRNSSLESQFEKSMKLSEKLVERLDVVESRIQLGQNEKENEFDKKNPSEEMKHLKDMFLEVLNNCENFECRVSLLELKSKDYNDSFRILKNEQTNLEGKLSKAAKLLDGACENIKENSSKASQHFVQEVEKLEDKLKILMEDKINTLATSTLQNMDKKAVNPKIAQQFQGAPIQLPPSSYHLQAVPIHPQTQQLLHFPQSFHGQYPQSFPAKLVPGVPYPIQTINIQHQSQSTKSPLRAEDLTESVSVVEEKDYTKLIGREGKTIDRIREQSGAAIIIREKCGNPPNKHFEVEYKGTLRQVEKAKELACIVLRQENSDTKDNKQSDAGEGEKTLGNKKSDSATMAF